MTASPPVTRQELDQALEAMYVRVEKMVGDVVGSIIGDALQMIAERFDKIDQKFAEIDRRFEAIDRRFDRLEDRLESVAATVDHHTIDIKQLQRKAAF